MKKFLHYIILTMLFLLLIDGCGRIVLNVIINNMPDNTSHLSKVNKSLSIKGVDFIVVGMSTAEHNYNVDIIENNLQMSGYNCGSDGRNLYYDYMIVKNAIKNNENLKLVIADVSYYSLTNVTKDRINIVYPFYWKNPIVRDVTKELKGKKMDYLMLSSFYQMNSGLQHLWRLYHPIATREYKGFSTYPYSGKELDLSKMETQTNEFFVDESAKMYLEKIIEECTTHNVSIVLVTSPTLDYNEDVTSYFSTFANNNHVRYLDYSQCEQIISNTKLFRDYYHLNEKGADVFSKLLVGEIKQIAYE